MEFLAQAAPSISAGEYTILTGIVILATTVTNGAFKLVGQTLHKTKETDKEITPCTAHGERIATLEAIVSAIDKSVTRIDANTTITANSVQRISGKVDQIVLQQKEKK